MTRRGPADVWTKRAKQQGFAARSVFKIDEIDDRVGLVGSAQRVLDLGCSPGSWSAYVRERGPSGVTIVGVDLKEVPGYSGTLIRDSVYDITSEALLGALGGQADLVLSDMAPSTTGNRVADHLQQIALAEAALELAHQVLRPNGSLVVKVFDGSDAQAFVQAMQQTFAKVRRIRPKATRSKSREFFAVAERYRG